MPTPSTSVPIRRRYSRKRAALTKAYGRPWRMVALEWRDKEELTLKEIAAAWTETAAAAGLDETFTEMDASRITRQAAQQEEGVQA